MGSDISKKKKREGPAAQRRLSHGFLSNVGFSINHRLAHSAVFSRPVGPNGWSPVPKPPLPPEDTEPSVPKPLLPPEDTKLPVPKPLLPPEDTEPSVPKPPLPPEDTEPSVPKPLLPPEDTKLPVPKPLLPPEDTKLPVPKPLLPPEDTEPSVPKPLLPPEDTETTPPAPISVFLPEFPQRRLPARDQFQILGFIAKGSYGPILKVRDIFKERTYAVKVLPKSNILKHGVSEQSKEEVVIQRQLKHPFIHNLQDCWQTQHHLFIMCDYCSVGDLYTYWLLRGQFGEDDVRLFAAELGSALGFLHDLGIVHRDIKMENILLNDQGHLRLSDFGLARRLKRGGRAFTICGTIQYMAPEVLGGGPYNHAADWWSFGVMLFSLVTGEFPLPAESDHTAMLKKVTDFPYAPPGTLSSSLVWLLSELLCKNPVTRLRNLECLEMQAFFRGTSFDSVILQKTPVEVILELRTRPDWAAKATRGLSLDYFDEFDCDKILYSPTTPTELSPTLTNTDPSPDTEHNC